MTHPLFGELHRVMGNMWDRELEIILFEKRHKIILSVDIDEDEDNYIESQQILAYQQFTQQQDKLLREAEQAMFDYYQSVCDEYRYDLDINDPNDKEVPIVSSLKGFSQLVIPEAITVPYVRPKATIGLLCKCTWEIEHGLAVKFEEGKVVEVGYQDIVL